MENYFKIADKDVLEYFKILEPNFPVWLKDYINTKGV